MTFKPHNISFSIPVILLLFFFLGGCATTAKYCTPPPPPNTGAVEFIIYRPHNSYGMLYSAPISINGCIINDLDDDAFIRHLAKPGKHVIRAEKRFLADGGDAEITVEATTGQRLYIRYSVKEDLSVTRYVPMPPFVYATTHPGVASFMVTPEDMAIAELPLLREASPGISDKPVKRQ